AVPGGELTRRRTQPPLTPAGCFDELSTNGAGMKQTIETENEYGKGTVKSWASIIDDATMRQAERISRLPIIEGYLALMPDAHFGFGPPVRSALKTKKALMPYAVGMDIRRGLIAVPTDLRRHDFGRRARRA